MSAINTTITVHVEVLNINVVCKVGYTPSQMKDHHCERNVVISLVLTLKQWSNIARL